MAQKKNALSEVDLNLLQIALKHINEGREETARLLLGQIQGDEADGKDQGLAEIYYMSAHLAVLCYEEMGEKGKNWVDAHPVVEGK